MLPRLPALSLPRTLFSLFLRFDSLSSRIVEITEVVQLG